MTEPLLSVVMSVRNGERFLAAAVESIINQTFRQFEFMIIDDGSTDGTPALLEKYARSDRRVRVVVQGARGLMPALNLGCGLSKSTYIARMDGDDIAPLNRFESQITALEADHAIGLIGGAMELIDKNGLPSEKVLFPESHSEIRIALREGNCFVHSAVMMRREAFEAVHGYRTAFQDTGDYDLWVRIAEKYIAANLADTMVLYRLHQGQVSVQKLEEQALSCVGVRVAAKRRQQQGADEFSAVERVTRELLTRFDVSAEEIDSTILQHYLSLAHRTGIVGDKEGSLQLLLAASRFCRSSSLGRRARSVVCALLARSCHGQGPVRQSLTHAIHACLLDPGLPSRWLLRRLVPS